MIKAWNITLSALLVSACGDASGDAADPASDSGGSGGLGAAGGMPGAGGAGSAAAGTGGAIGGAGTGASAAGGVAGAEGMTVTGGESNPGSGGAVASGGEAGTGATGGASNPGSGGTAAAGAGGAPATGGVSGAGGNAAGGSGGSAGACMDPDSCPYSDGVEWLCRLRFMYGMNYAWHHFGGDFGGVGPWSQSGVSGNPAVADDLNEMAANGVSVVRWWVWPDFRGDAVTLDGAGMAGALGGTAIADLQRALELADQLDLYLMLVLFSFDNFRSTHTSADIEIPSIAPTVLNPTARAALMDNVVRPFVRAGAESPHAEHIVAWEVINEPEWAITGAGKYGDDEPFDPNPELDAVTHEQMEAFVRDVVGVVHSESNALVTVGGAAMKWKNAWSAVGLDFHQFHIYDWVDQYWPYSRSPAEYGVDDLPVVMGEFYTTGLSSAAYPALLDSWFSNGYAGALSWQYNEVRGQLAQVKAFADAHSCQTQY